MRCTAASPRPNGGAPVHASNRVAPSANRSTAGEQTPVSASGAAYPSVPRAAPSPGRGGPASPKSIRIARPSAPRRTLAGQTSPWTSPRPCRWASAPAISPAARCTATRRGPSSAMLATLSIDGPAMRSVTRNARPSAARPTSRTRTMLGCPTACSRASSSIAAPRPPAPARNSLATQAAPSVVSTTANVSPLAPSASRSPDA